MSINVQHTEGNITFKTKREAIEAVIKLTKYIEDKAIEEELKQYASLATMILERTAIACMTKKQRLDAAADMVMKYMEAKKDDE